MPMKYVGASVITAATLAGISADAWAARVDYTIDLSTMARDRLSWNAAAKRLDVQLPPLALSRPNLDEGRAQSRLEIANRGERVFAVERKTSKAEPRAPPEDELERRLFELDRLLGFESHEPRSREREAKLRVAIAHLFLEGALGADLAVGENEVIGRLEYGRHAEASIMHAQGGVQKLKKSFPRKPGATSVVSSATWPSFAQLSH